MQNPLCLELFYYQQKHHHDQVTYDDDIEREKKKSENESIFWIGFEFSPLYHDESDK